MIQIWEGQRNSISAIVKAAEEFEKALGVPCIQHDLGTRVRRDFENQARERCYCLNFDSSDLQKVLYECDTVDAMEEAIRRFTLEECGKSVDTVRSAELVRDMRVDTKKLFGCWGYDKLTQKLDTQVMNKGRVEALTAWGDYILGVIKKNKALTLSGVDSSSSSFDYSLKGVIYTIVQLIQLHNPKAVSIDKNAVWGDIYKSGMSCLGEGNFVKKHYKNGRIDIVLTEENYEIVSRAMAKVYLDWALA